MLFAPLPEEGVGRGHHAQGQCYGVSSASPWSAPGLLGHPCHFPVLHGGRRWRDGGPGFCSCLQLSQGGAWRSELEWGKL